MPDKTGGDESSGDATDESEPETVLWSETQKITSQMLSLAWHKTGRLPVHAEAFSPAARLPHLPLKG